jgi:single-stranded DNA-binding protein
MNTVTIRGNLTRVPYTSERFAAFSVRPLKVTPDDRTPILDVVVFDAGPIAVAKTLKEGDLVGVTGHLNSKKLQNKAKSDVKVDDRDVWVIQLVADEVLPEGKTAESDDSPF